jgi:hypothetical protein
VKSGTPFDAFQTDAISFEGAKVSQSDGGGSFKLSLCLIAKVFMIVM